MDQFIQELGNKMKSMDMESIALDEEIVKEICTKENLRMTIKLGTGNIFTPKDINLTVSGRRTEKKGWDEFNLVMVLSTLVDG